MRQAHLNLKRRRNYDDLLKYAAALNYIISDDTRRPPGTFPANRSFSGQKKATCPPKLVLLGGHCGHQPRDETREAQEESGMARGWRERDAACLFQKQDEDASRHPVLFFGSLVRDARERCQSRPAPRCYGYSASPIFLCFIFLIFFFS